MGERRKLTEKRQIIRQSIDTRKLSTYSLALDRQIYTRQSGFRRRIVFDGNTLKEKTQIVSVFFQLLPQKITLFKSALCMSSPIVRILISMPFPCIGSFHMYIKCARPPYIIEIKNVRTRKDVHPDSDAIADA